MSFIDNIKNDIEEASARYDLMNDKIMLFESVAYNNYIIKQKEAYLDAYRYGGDVEDYMTESEGGSFADKIKSTIRKIADALREFLQKCKEKIIEMMQKIRESSLVEKLENLFKANPNTSKIKVEIDDNSKKINLLEKARDSLQKQKAKIKSGKISEKDGDEIEDRNNKIAVVVAASAATVAVTLGTILILLKKRTKEANNSLSPEEKAYNEWLKIVDELTTKGKNYDMDKDNWGKPSVINMPGKTEDLTNYYKPSTSALAVRKTWADSETSNVTVNYNPEIGHILTSGAAQESKIKQAIAKLHLSEISNLINAAKIGISTIGNNATEATSKLKGKTKVPTPSVESAYEDSFDADDYFSELCNDIFGDDTSTEDDFDTMYSELCNDIFF